MRAIFPPNGTLVLALLVGVASPEKDRESMELVVFLRVLMGTTLGLTVADGVDTGKTSFRPFSAARKTLLRTLTGRLLWEGVIRVDELATASGARSGRTGALSGDASIPLEEDSDLAVTFLSLALLKSGVLGIVFRGSTVCGERPIDDSLSAMVVAEEEVGNLLPDPFIIVFDVKLFVVVTTVVVVLMWKLFAFAFSWRASLVNCVMQCGM